MVPKVWHILIRKEGCTESKPITVTLLPRPMGCHMGCHAGVMPLVLLATESST